MSTNILILDNTIDPDSWGSRELTRLSKLSPHSTFHVRRPPHQDLPASPERFDKVIVSGSKTSVMDHAAWITELLEFIRVWVQSGKPFLGICYGHQALAMALWGEHFVRKAAKPEVGWTEITLTADSPLTHELPKTFYTISRHYDEVSKVSSDATVFAKSKDCAIQGFQLKHKPVFGIQFHPERDLADCAYSYERMKKTNQHKTFNRYSEGKKLYNPKVGEDIFGKFLAL